MENKDKNELLNYIEVKKLLKFILENKSFFNLDNEDFFKDFMKDYETIMLYPRALPLDTKFLLFFNIIKEAIMEYDDQDSFNDIRSLILIKNRFFYYNKANIQDIKTYFNYLVTYCYYHSLSTHHLYKLMTYYKDNYEEILEWCIENNIAEPAFEDIYYIKRIYYNYVTDYIERKLSNNNDYKVIL